MLPTRKCLSDRCPPDGAVFLSIESEAGFVEMCERDGAVIRPLEWVRAGGPAPFQAEGAIVISQVGEGLLDGLLEAEEPAADGAACRQVLR